MPKIAIITDSSAQIRETIDDVYVLPLQVMIGEKVYLDGLDIDEPTLFRKMQNEPIIPKTSQPSFGAMIELMEQLKSQYDEAIAVVIGTGLSSTLDSLHSAAEIVGFKLSSIDSKTTCRNQRELVLLTKKLIKQEQSVSEIVQTVEKYVNDAETFILPTDLNYLKRGGRLTPGAALIAGMLKIIPILRLNPELGGKIDQFAKVRTMKKAYNEVFNYFLRKGLNAKHYLFTVGHALNEELASQINQEMTHRFGSIDVEIVYLPTVVGSHTGTGCVGLQWIRKTDNPM